MIAFFVVALASGLPTVKPNNASGALPPNNG